MAFKATKSQQDAIDAKGNILVAAAAGSGKTAVLTERVVKMLSDKQNPVSADRLLIVTFTNAAAAEMRSRIEARLYKECQDNPDDVFLMKQKQLIQSADICTIDSFCINLVRENFEKCGVAPDFKIGNRARLNELSKKAMAVTMTELFKNNSPEFKKLLELTGCENDEVNLINAIEKVYTYSRQLPFPDRFINSLKKPYEMPFDKEHPWYKSAFLQAKEYINSIRLYIEELTEQSVKMKVDGEAYIGYSEKAALLIDTLSDGLDSSDWNEFKELLSTASFPSLPRAKEKGDPYVDAAKETKKKASDTLKDLSLLFRQTKEEIERETAELKDAIIFFCSIVNSFANKLYNEFNEDGNFDFYNTEQLALELLCICDDEGNISIREDANELINRYDQVLVDEFQDVNDLQNLLFYALSNKEQKLFAVGDLKQSIYGFRGSNPKNFLNKKNIYKDYDLFKEQDVPKKIILSDNFRSSKGVCEYVNFFFSQMLNGELGDFVYDDSESLNAAAKFPETEECPAKILLVDMYDSVDEDKLLSYEAKAIAKYILDTVNSKKPIINAKDGTLRSANFADFAILVNALKGKGDIIAETLEQNGIPVALNSSVYTETAEISLMLALLKVIDNPRSDTELLAVLLSPIFNFTPEELAKIRAEFTNGDIYSAVLSSAEKGNQKALEFRKKLSDMRTKSVAEPLDSFINYLLNSTGILDFMTAISNGSLRRSNLLSLVNYAKSYCSVSGGGIGQFVNYMLTAAPETFKTSIGAAGNSVKIMTMHASKGLQFPICIIAGNTSIFNSTDSTSRVLFNDTEGITFKYFNESLKETVRSVGHMLSAKKASINTVEEKMRLLYVAMTRAEDILVMVSSSKNLESTVNRISKNIILGIKGSWLKSTNSINDWLISAALTHKDGKALREMSDTEINVLDHESHLEIIRYTDDELEIKAVQGINAAEFEADEEIAKAISRNIGFVYPFESLKGVQAKASASVVANKEESLKFGFTERPIFMLNAGLTAAQKGTAVHKVMQFINMQGKPCVKSEIERLCEFGFISESEADAIDIRLIEKFFKTSLFLRILNSKGYRREMRFMTEMSAIRLDSTLTGIAAETPVIIQGAVDLVFEEEDGLVIVDFKTDRTDNPDTLRHTYSEQLNIYAKACEKIYNKEVKQKILYSFALSQEIVL